MEEQRPNELTDDDLQTEMPGTPTPKPGGDSLGLNDIARVSLRCASELAFDAYRDNRWTGAFILIDEATNDTVGAGMIST